MRETVTPVGYGDYTPVTPRGADHRLFRHGYRPAHTGGSDRVGGIELRRPGPSRAERPPPDQAATPGMTLAELDQRLARVEELLASQHRHQGE